MTFLIKKTRQKHSFLSSERAQNTLSWSSSFAKTCSMNIASSSVSPSTEKCTSPSNLFFSSISAQAASLWAAISTLQATIQTFRAGDSTLRIAHSALRAANSAFQVAASANVLKSGPTISTKLRKFSDICSIIRSLACPFLFRKIDVFVALLSYGIGEGDSFGSCLT